MDKIKTKLILLLNLQIRTARLLCAVLLLEHYLKSLESFDLEVYLRWVNLKPIYNPDKSINVYLFYLIYILRLSIILFFFR